MGGYKATTEGGPNFVVYGSSGVRIGRIEFSREGWTAHSEVGTPMTTVIDLEPEAALARLLHDGAWLTDVRRGDGT
jgi:hypothetical protein